MHASYRDAGLSFKALWSGNFEQREIYEKPTLEIPNLVRGVGCTHVRREKIYESRCGRHLQFMLGDASLTHFKSHSCGVIYICTKYPVLAGFRKKFPDVILLISITVGGLIRSAAIGYGATPYNAGHKWVDSFLVFGTARPPSLRWRQRRWTHEVTSELSAPSSVC